MIKFNLIFLIFILTGCTKINCPAFDTNHSVNQWNWFQADFSTFEFFNSNQMKLVFERTKYEKSNAEEFRCSSCKCVPNMTISFSELNHNIQLSCGLSNGAMKNEASVNDKGEIHYTVDQIVSSFSPVGQGIEENVYPKNGIESKFIVKELDSLELLNETFVVVFEIETRDTSKSDVKRIWLQKNKGIIGFSYRNENWKKK